MRISLCGVRISDGYHTGEIVEGYVGDENVTIKLDCEGEPFEHSVGQLHLTTSRCPCISARVEKGDRVKVISGVWPDLYGETGTVLSAHKDGSIAIQEDRVLNRSTLLWQVNVVRI